MYYSDSSHSSSFDWDPIQNIKGKINAGKF